MGCPRLAIAKLAPHLGDRRLATSVATRRHARALSVQGRRRSLGSRYMPIQTIRDETRALIADFDKKVALAERFLADGTGAEKVRAAGDLSLLKRHRQELA